MQCRKVHHDILCRCPAAFLSFGFAHDYGVIRDMQWCPSGCWEKEMTTPIASSSCWSDKETTSDGELRRLGLLAVASSDGKLRILRYQCVTVYSISETRMYT